MRRIPTWIALALALTLALAGCQMAAEPAPTGAARDETPPGAEPSPPTGQPTAEATEAATLTAELPPATEAAATPTAAMTPTPAIEEKAATPGAEAAPTVDGAVAEGEYPNTTSVGDMQMWWHNDGESLTMAVQGPTEGWIGVGLDPDASMQGADFKLAAVENGEARVTDAWGMQPTGPNHPPDTELGGTDDIAESAVVTEDGVTRFEFRIPLDSGDQYDKPLEPGGTYPIIVAHASSDDYTAYHSFRQSAEITLDPAP